MLLAVSGGLWAQVERDEYEEFRRQYQEEFQEFRRKEMEEYDEFRRKANAEYAEWLGKPWVEMKAEGGLKPPEVPKPSVPPVHRDATPLDETHGIVIGTLDTVQTFADTIHVPDIIYTPEQAESQTEVDFYAEKIAMRVARGAASLRLGGTSEKKVRKAWAAMASGTYDALLQDCISAKRRNRLCDWAYIKLCQRAASSVFSPENYNEMVLLQAYLLTQSGYNLRLATSQGRLSILVPFDHLVYNYNFIPIDKEKYYIIDGRKAGAFSVVPVGFPKGRTSSIAMGRQPRLAERNATARAFTANGRYPSMQIKLTVNRNLMEFYSEYPLNDAWSSYASASLSEGTKAALYPALRKHVQGKSKAVATDMLLDFVQHAFAYKTDQEQFGYERPLFGDESFYYPYNDCEDRSILFAILVRELLGLDVVLLNYPGHLATAVSLGSDVKGDYVLVDGRRYTVCDPTYIGAAVGEGMPQFDGMRPRVIVIR